jgi:CysZ protein
MWKIGRFEFGDSIGLNGEPEPRQLIRPSRLGFPTERSRPKRWFPDWGIIRNAYFRRYFLQAVIRALSGAVGSLFHPVILVTLWVPMVVALILWFVIGWIFWDAWISGVQATLLDMASWSWTADWDLTKVASGMARVAVILLLIPATLVTAMLVAALFAMPMLVRHVEARNFPGLERRSGGTVLGGIWNAIAAVSIFLLLWLATLPLWLLGFPAIVLPFLLSAYLNQRLFRYDALSEHADAFEMKRIFQEARGRLFLLGLATGALYFVPLVNLVAPVFSALAFIHLCLNELVSLRAVRREA